VATLPGILVLSMVVLCVSHGRFMAVRYVHQYTDINVLSNGAVTIRFIVFRIVFAF